MAWHIIGPFVGMGKVRIVVGDQAVQVVLKVPTGRGVGVFHKNEATARMTTENSEDTIFELRRFEGISGFVGNLVGPLSVCFNMKLGLNDLHRLLLGRCLACVRFKRVVLFWF